MSEDTQNSTAVAATPVQQSTDATVTNPPATPPTQQPAAPAAAAPSTPSTPDTSLVPQGTGESNTPDPSTAGTTAQLTPGATDPTNPTNAGSGTGNTLPLNPSAPNVAAPDPKAAAADDAHPWTRRLLATAQRLTGGPQYTTTIGTDGVAHRVEQQTSGRSLGWALALEALTGGLAAAPAKGTNATGAGAAAGLEQGEKIAEGKRQTQEAADQKAQQDQIRQFQTLKTNLDMAQTMQAIGKHDYDVANGPVELNAKAIEYWQQKDPGKIGDPDVSEKDSMDVSKFPAHEYYRVPTMTVPREDPNTGLQTWQDSHGAPVAPGTPFAHAAWDHRYAMIHRDADVPTHDDEGNVDPGLQAQADAGVTAPTMLQAGQTTKMPAGNYIQGNAQVSRQNAANALINGPHGVVALVNHYRQLVSKDPSKAAPNAVDPATDSVYDLFGGNTSKLADFITEHEQGSGVQANGQPTRGVRDNNPGNLVADKSWTGPVDDKNLPPGQAPFRVYPSKEDGARALDEQLMKWKEENPHQSIQSFFSRYTTPGTVGPDGLNDQQRYIQQAMTYKGNNATDITKQAGQLSQVDIKKFMQENPDADRTLQAFQKAFYTNNKTASLQTALDNMPDTRQKAMMVKLLGNDPTIAGDYDASRQNEKTAIMEMTRNQAKLQYNDQKRQQEESGILERNSGTINAILNGSAIDLRGILTMRAYDREIVTNELIKRSNGAYNPASIQNMIDLNKEINEKQTVGSFGNKLAGYQTAFQHTSAANEQLKVLQSLVPGLAGNTTILNGSLADVAKRFEGISPQAAHAYQQYLTLVQTATHDWQNALNNGHALHQEDLENANGIINGTTSFGNAQSALQGMMHSLVPRIDPLNEQYKTTMSTANQKVNYPNLIEPATVDSIKKLNDPATMQMVAHYESGGTITGGPRGLGSQGKEVGLLLTPAAPKPGTALKDQKNAADIAKQYVRVYGNNAAEVKRAMQANGWQ